MSSVARASRALERLIKVRSRPEAAYELGLRSVLSQLEVNRIDEERDERLIGGERKSRAGTASDC
jgi:hypothetical protein